MMNQGIWIWLSFDLGVNGDYAGMYSWLDNHKARECGSSFAILQFEYEGDLMESLKEEIHEQVDLGKRSRVYVVYKKDDGKVYGRYLIGGRKSAPWEGYGDYEMEEDEGDIQ